jgi:hypothetical protein
VKDIAVNIGITKKVAECEKEINKTLQRIAVKIG